MKTIEGDLSINNKKVALVAGRFNSFIVEHLISGAKEALLKSGTKESDIDLIYVPGAFEIPPKSILRSCKSCARSPKSRSRSKSCSQSFCQANLSHDHKDKHDSVLLV